MKKKVTINDLAKRAEVSVTTVSQILNGKGDRFSKKTVEKVHELQKEMGYVPDFNAQSLIRRSGRTLGIIVPNINNPFFSRFLRGIESAALERDYVPLVFGSNDSEKQETRYLFESIRRAADGLIIASAVSDLNEIDHILSQNEISYLLIDQAPVKDGDQVEVHNYDGGKLLADHLLKNGHTDVSVVKANKPTTNLEERLQGFLDAFDAAGHKIEPSHVISADLTKMGGYEAADSVLKTKTTAVFAINDEVAFGLYRAFAEKGISIPDDISVVGYDDIDLAEYFTPKLTTVHQPAFEMGETAAKLLIDRIENRDTPKQRVSLSIHLEVRDSVKKITE
ncbi:LacI family DNA-binding transcriptional regulator [Lentilactobacillus sp. Marseille-Q4993]|uniref:ribose utilization transcriptional repressor RbsR n=1 Tax=Lentilactobacillus sp. Marseille-Q4993 TaxID=3039492 RepID=UPI0024BC8BF0|nr:LacI family DNA-binding transcriptional regulator [Lentilactobacillus sp. Marseille-Q4993]